MTTKKPKSKDPATTLIRRHKIVIQNSEVDLAGGWRTVVKVADRIAMVFPGYVAVGNDRMKASKKLLGIIKNSSKIGQRMADILGGDAWDKLYDLLVPPLKLKTKPSPFAKLTKTKWEKMGLIMTDDPPMTMTNVTTAPAQ